MASGLPVLVGAELPILVGPEQTGGRYTGRGYHRRSRRPPSRPDQRYDWLPLAASRRSGGAIHCWSTRVAGMCTAWTLVLTPTFRRQVCPSSLAMSEQLCRTIRHRTLTLSRGPTRNSLWHGGHLAMGWNFTVPVTVGQPGQPDWRFCRKCSVLYFAGEGFDESAHAAAHTA